MPSLACLWQSQDKHSDAYDLLAPVHGWFTDGVAAADLQDVNACSMNGLVDPRPLR